MTHAKRIAVFVLASAAVLIGSGIVHAEDLRGTIVRTLILSEDSRLVGDITCQVTGAPCIAFGAPNIAPQPERLHDHRTERSRRRLQGHECRNGDRHQHQRSSQCRDSRPRYRPAIPG